MFRRIRDLREGRDISQQRMAGLLRINQTTYSKYERGILNVPCDVLIFLAGFHKVSVDYLLGLTDVKDPYPRTKK